MTSPTRDRARRPAHLLGAAVPASLLALMLVASPALTALWWPTQAKWVETAHITPDDAHERGNLGNPSHWGIHFGSTVAIDGDRMVAGTQYDPFDDGWKTPSGDGGDWAYVFERDSGGEWEQVAKLIPNDAREGDTFAYSVAIDADRGIVVAGNPVLDEPNFGKIYIFERGADGSWSQTASFTPPPEATKIFGNYGRSVAVSGHTVVTGWHPNAYVYEKTEGEWKLSDTVRGATFVDIEQDTLVTSIFTPGPRHQGYAVYTRTGDSWAEVARLDPASRYDDHPLGGTKNTIGCQASLNEDATTVVMGACIDRRIYGVPTEHEIRLGDEEAIWISGGPVGSVWIYERVDGEWVFSADLPNPDPQPAIGDLFGLSVDVSANTVVVGAPFDNLNSGQEGDGAAYVYERIQGEWIVTSKLRNHDNGPYGGKDLFGSSVGISGDTVVAGAPFDDQRRDGTPFPLDDRGDTPSCMDAVVFEGCDEGENAGSAYVFEPATRDSGVGVG